MSISKVARHAGVSTATVSRVINRHRNVTEKTSRLVRQAMSALGYEPPPLSRRPGPRTPARQGIIQNAVALLMIGVKQAATFGNVFGSLLHGVEEALAANELDMTIAQIGAHDRLPMAMERGHLDGLLLFGKMPDAKLRRKLEAFPCVWLLGVFEPVAAEWGDHVTCDNAAIGRMALNYLHGKGHSRVAFFNPISTHPDFPARQKAFQSAARKAGLRVSMLQERAAAAAFPEIREIERLMEPLLEKLVRLKPMPTGIFCPGDLMTALMYRGLQMRGIKPGTDLEIVSCNNEQAFLAGLNPRPATISIAADEIGRRGVEQLLYRLRRPENAAGEVIHISPRLIPGDT